MLPVQLATENLHVLHPTIRVDYGREVADWSNPTLGVTIKRCSVQPEQSTEIIDDREATVWRMRVWAPPTAPVEATSRLRWRGVDYRVVGEVLPWHDPTSQGLDHIEFQMTASEG